MKSHTTYHIYKLKESLGNAQKLNSRYSLRSFAKKLGMHSSTLSLVLKGERPIPKKNIEDVVRVLVLSPKEETLFRESLTRGRTRIDNIKISDELKQRYFIEESQFSVLAEWEHYALLSLIETEGFIYDFEYISAKLGISKTRTEVVVENLFKADLVEASGEDKSLVLKKSPLRTTEDISSRALQKSHIETLEIAKNKLEEVEVTKRDYSSMTVAIDPDSLPEAKVIIREFRQKMASLLRDGTKKDVYQLAIQLFPLTKELQE